MNLKYTIKRIFSADFRNFFATVSKTSKLSKHNWLYTFLDIIYCGFAYGAGFSDYALFEMYNMTKDERKNVITRGKNAELIRKYNNPDYYHLMQNKAEANAFFAEFLHRSWLNLADTTPEAVDIFLNHFTEIMLKPTEGMCGKGIEKLTINPETTTYIKTKIGDKFILEEVIKQSNKMNALNPSSINTLRVVSFNKNGNIAPLATYVRIGNGDIVDNFNSGGMMAPVDKTTGIITHPALDKAGNLYEVHPTTGTKIVGFEIPEFKQALSLARLAHSSIPEIGIAGFDIGFAEVGGPCLVEANELPGHDIYDLPPHRGEKVGLLDEFQNIIARTS